jgi:hypothetical protein
MVAPAAARLYAKHALPHRLADSKEMDEFLQAIRHSTCNPPHRAAVKVAQTLLASALRSEVITKLKQYSVTSPISVAIDGWTNTRHDKVTNLLCLCGGQAYYWCSIVNRYDQNTAAWLLKPISAAIAELMKHDIRIAALVADNEAVNGKLYNLLTPQFPFLLLSPCAAHTIQLCVNKTLKQPGVFDVMTTMEGVIRQFRKGKLSKRLRLQLANIQRQSMTEARVKPLVIPCDTRWSSHRAAGIRLLELQPFIAVCELPQRPADSFWSQLKELVEFLLPFQTATDVIQADNSTLYTVYQQFQQLLSYVDAVPGSSTFVSVMYAVHNIIVRNWEKHVNKPAALSCAWFSFDSGIRDYDTADLTATKQWFISYAVTYAKQYKLRPGVADDLIRGKLEELWGQFTGRSVGTPFAGLDETVARVKAAQLTESRRLVDGQWLATWYPVSVWRSLESEVPLFAHPAIALLCVAGSEAAVERSFSAQDSVHTKRRNRLSDQSVQNEMFIRFNSDAVRGVRPDTAERRKTMYGGTCVELTPDFDERPSSRSSVKALFRLIAIAEEEENEAAEPAVEEEKNPVDQKDEASDSSDSDYVDEGGPDSESGSESSSSQSTSGSDSSRGQEQRRPLSRRASIAKQVALEDFITMVIDDNGWTRETDWNNRELVNIIEAAALQHSDSVKVQTKALRGLIKARVMMRG